MISSSYYTLARMARIKEVYIEREEKNNTKGGCARARTWHPGHPPSGVPKKPSDVPAFCLARIVARIATRIRAIRAIRAREWHAPTGRYRVFCG